MLYLFMLGDYRPYRRTSHALSLRVLLKPVLEGVVGVAHFITGTEQAKLNRVCHFHFLAYSLLPKDLTIQNLFTVLFDYKM